MNHSTECPFTVTTASNGAAIIILQKCPCYSAPVWDGTKGVSRKA